MSSACCQPELSELSQEYFTLSVQEEDKKYPLNSSKIPTMMIHA